VITYLRGRGDAALASLKELVQQEKEHVRAWALLALLTGDGRDAATYERALKALVNLRGTSPDVRLMLAELYVSRKDWGAARAELDQVVRMNPRLVRAWEMMVSIDFQERKRELAEDHVRILLTLDPGNYTGNLLLGSFQYARGQFALAESSYRAALAARRDPVALNDLAYLLMIKGGSLDEAAELVAEALERHPQHALFLSTRSEILLRQGRLEEAERDLQLVMTAMPDNAQALLLSAQVYAARGQQAAALELAESLATRLGELPAEQQSQVQDLLRQLR
jgi:Tfp pilus assembly protein PilF